jgi:Flp pilus assembly protein TadG
MRLRPVSRPARVGECGATFVEATLVVPLVVLMIITLAGLGLAVADHAMYTDGVRDAGRAGVANSLDDCDAKAEIAKSTLEEHLRKYGLKFDSSGVEVSWPSKPGVDGSPDERGLKLSVKGKVGGVLNVTYQSFTKLEGDASCS